MTASRYLLRTFAFWVVSTLLGATAFMATVDFAELAGSLFAHDQPWSVAGRLYLHKLPIFAVQALPLALLFGVLLAITDLTRRRELLAMRAAGAGALRLAAPAIFLAFVLSALGGWVSDTVAPSANRVVVETQTRTLKRWTWYWTIFHKHQTWFLGEGNAVLRVDQVLDAGQTLRDVLRVEYHGGRLETLTHAETLRWVDGAWAGEGVARWAFDETGPHFSQTLGPFQDPPSHSEGVLGQPDELTSAELVQAMETRQAQGRSTLRHEVELWYRWAAPPLNLALVILALGIVLGIRLPRSPVEAAAVGIAIAFAGWTLLAITRALGMSGMLDPGLAAAIPPTLLGIAGLALLVLRR